MRNQRTPRNWKFDKLLIFLPLLLLCSVGYSQTDDLYRTIVKLDSTFFQAYNNCDLATQERFYSDSIEFFHDKSGLETSKEKILASTKKYICGKVTRELVKGSIEVSPLPGYGALNWVNTCFITIRKRMTHRTQVNLLLSGEITMENGQSLK